MNMSGCSFSIHVPTLQLSVSSKVYPFDIKFIFFCYMYVHAYVTELASDMNCFDRLKSRSNQNMNNIFVVMT